MKLRRPEWPWWLWALFGMVVLIIAEAVAFVVISYAPGSGCSPRVWFAGNTALVTCL